MVQTLSASIGLLAARASILGQPVGAAARTLHIVSVCPLSGHLYTYTTQDLHSADISLSSIPTHVENTLSLSLVIALLLVAASPLGINGAGLTFAQTDTTDPTISSVAITSDTGDDEVYLDDDGIYGIGDEVEVTVTFNENVVVTGSPQLELNIGGSPEIASYDSTDGSKVVFGYTVAVGDSDADGISIAADKLSLNGGTIKDAAVNSADLSHSAEAAQTGHKVDGIRPTITAAPLFSGSTYSTDGVHTIGEELIANVHFSENVYVGGNPGPQLKLNIRGTTKSADFFSAVPECKGPGLCLISLSPFDRHGTRLIFEYEIVRGDLDLDGVEIDANSLVLNGGSIRDGAGNDAVLTHSAAASNPIVDGVPATIKSIAVTSDPGDDNTYRMGDMIEVTVTFSEVVRVPRLIGSGGVRMPRLELNIGGVAKLAKTHESASITGAVIVFRYTVQDGDNDSNGISIGANKLFLNGGTIRDANGTCCPGGNQADLTHTAVADDAGQKVAASSQPSDKSTDATLKGLILSGIDFGTFASGTESYTATVPYSVSRTAVTPTVNHSGARYVIRLNGANDSDGKISLSAGSNVISVEVTAEDENTVKTYTVTVTLEAASTDATLKGLTLSGIDLGTFASGTESYTATVPYSVSQTRVFLTTNHSGASYVTKLGGVEVPYGWGPVIALSVGSNVITVEVTAEDGLTTKTYTVSVTRGAPSPDATLKALTLSGIDFGTFASSTLSYTVDVTNDPTETTVTPTVNHSGASHVIKIGGVTDADGVIPLVAGDNVITIEVTAEDGTTTRTYTVTVTRLVALEQNSPDATLSGLTLSGVNFGTFASGTESYTASVAHSVTQTTVTPTVNDSNATYVIKLGGVTDADGTVSLAVGSNVITVEVTAEDDSTTKTYTVTVTRAEPPSTDATLKALNMSGVDFGTFDSTTVSYTASVANSVNQTAVNPTVNDSGASYVIRIGGKVNSDGVVSLAVGSNVITIEVTAEDDSTTKTYTVTVTRAEPPSTDATLKSLTLSGVDFGIFSSDTASYTASVTNSVTQTTVTPAVNDSGASYVIKLGGVTDADGTVALRVGSNTITVEVTAEDGQTTKVYTVTVTRAAASTPEQPSSDASLRSLTLSGVNFGTFDSTTTSYTAQVANSVTQTTVTATINDSGASYVVRLGGVTDADGVVSLAVGSNVIAVVVTAEDRSTTRTYTVSVNRSTPTSSDATLSALTLTGVNYGSFSSGTTVYTAQVANSVSQTTVTPTVNHSGASYVVRLGDVTDADGTVSLAVGTNVISIVVTAQDRQTTRTYTVTVTRAAPLSTDATLRALTLTGVNFGTFDSTTTSYTAQVANSVSQTTVTPTPSDSGASYVIKLGGVTDADGVISLAVGGNVITVEVTAQNGTTNRIYTVTVTRASQDETPPRSPDPVTGELPTDDPRVNFRVSSYTHDSVGLAWSVPQNRGITKYVVQRHEHDGSGFVSSGSGVGARFEGNANEGGGHALLSSDLEPDTLYQYVLMLKDGGGATIIESSSSVRTLSTDATLSALSLSGIDFGTFDPATTSYTAEVGTDVSQTTVSPTISHLGASYTIELDGVAVTNGEVTLEVGENIITVEVTAEDGETKLTYTVTVTRMASSLLAGELPTDDPPVNFRITNFGEDEVGLAWEIPQQPRRHRLCT